VHSILTTQIVVQWTARTLPLANGCPPYRTTGEQSPEDAIPKVGKRFSSVLIQTGVFLALALYAVFIWLAACYATSVKFLAAFSELAGFHVKPTAGKVFWITTSLLVYLKPLVRPIVVHVLMEKLASLASTQHLSTI